MERARPAEADPDPAGSARDRFLAHLERALQALDDPDEIMATAARLLGEHMQVDRSAYAEAEADEDHFTMTGSYARGLPELTGRMAMSDFSADTLRCMRGGVPYVLADAETDPRVLPEQRDIYHRTGIAAVICVPLHKSGRFIAAMAVHQRTPRAWTDAEVELLGMVVNRCWESLQRAHALGAAEESEQRFRMLVDRASDGIWLADDALRYIDVNPAACAMLGYTREEHLALTVRDVVRPEDMGRLDALIATLRAGESVTEVWEMRRRDGSTVPVELSMRAGARGRVQAIGRDITERRRAEAEREALLHRVQQANQQLRLLQRATAALSAAATPAEVGAVVVARLRQLLGEPSVAVWERVGTGDLRVLAVHDWPFDAAGPPLARVAAERPLWLVDDATWAGHDPDLRAELRGHGHGCLGWLPLLVGEQRLGAVAVGLPAPLDASARATLEALADQCAQALQRARLHEAEHDIAEALQRSLLPRELPALTAVAAAARYTPAAEHTSAGGDWYDMLPVGSHRVAVAVGDVVGHGPAAAAVMGQLRSALAAQLLDGHPPAAALERLDRFAAGVTGSAGTTCACLTYDWSTGELRWALAGHLPVLVVDDDGARYLDGPGGAALGVRGRPAYTEASTTLAAGASVVLYTDGLVERRDEVLDTGLARLGDAARGLADRGPDELAQALVDAALGPRGPADDVALLVLRALPAPLHVRLPAAGASMRRLRRAVSTWSSRVGLSEVAVEDLELAVGEAAANAAEHAYPDGGGHFECSLTRTPDGGVQVRVRDRGRWRPAPADNGHRGHGLRVIGRLTRDFVVERTGGGTEVRFRLPAPEPGIRPRSEVARRSGARVPLPARVEHRAGPAGQVVLAVHGDVDLAGRDAVGPELLAAAQRDGDLVVDLTGVGYLSSAGVALLAEASAAAGPRLAILVADGSAPARVLQLTGLAGVLAVHTVAHGQHRSASR